MKQSYLANYIQLYFWQFVAILLNFASMLIVLPLLAKNRELFGIYSFSISLIVFLSYADIGFISSGLKYASEFFSQNDIEREVGVTGFSLFILSLGLILYFGAMLLFWSDPTIILSDLSIATKPVASSMFLILAIFTPAYVLQKAGMIIYGVRVEDYIPKKINIIGHLVKIGSIFYFFREGVANIVGYFLFFQIINLICFLTAFILSKHLYNYPVNKLIQSIRFSKKYYIISKNLALASFTASIAWVIYYELDNMAVGKILGISDLGVYAVGFSLLSFLRSIYGVLFSPLNARFNHFMGLKDYFGLKEFYAKILRTLFPVLTFPLISGLFLMNNLVLTWVGSNYQDAFQIARLLVATILFAFLSYPAGILLIAQERTKTIYRLNLLLIVVFWGGVVLTVQSWGLFSFAFFKLIAYLASIGVFSFITIRFLELSIFKLIKQNLPGIFVSVGIIAITTLPFLKWLPMEKSPFHLILVVTWGAFSTSLAWIAYFLINRPFRGEFLFVVDQVRQRI